MTHDQIPSSLWKPDSIALEDPAVLVLDELQQVLHLVALNVPVREDEVLRSIRNIGHVEQLHVDVVDIPVRLPVVTGETGRNDVHPRVGSTSRLGMHVIPRQLGVGIPVATVGTYVQVSSEECLVRELGNSIVQIGAVEATNGHDVVDVHGRPLARERGVTTVDRKGIAESPRNEVLRDILRGSLVVDPLDGQTALIELKYLWNLYTHLSVLYFVWWSRRESNPRPMPCEDIALPLSYGPSVDYLYKGYSIIKVYTSKLSRKPIHQ